ncbi:MAG: TlpA family protein disulfide reductase [Alphaproteobacteria bacterium]|nr:TlpA family protein disulfide reductase [Alphaproteobacteria bacterium]
MTRRTRRGAVRWGILLFGLLVVGALVGLLYQGFGKDPHALPSTLEGRTAPPFQLVTMDGRPVSLEGLQGKPVVLNFWATWCVPCAQEHAILQEGARAYSKQGVVFLGVLYNDKPDLAAGFLEKRGSAYPTLLDPTGSTAVDFGVSGVPETFFIDPDGVIARKVTGPVSTSVLVTAIEEML